MDVPPLARLSVVPLPEAVNVSPLFITIVVPDVKLLDEKAFFRVEHAEVVPHDPELLPPLEVTYTTFVVGTSESQLNPSSPCIVPSIEQDTYSIMVEYKLISRTASSNVFSIITTLT